MTPQQRAEEILDKTWREAADWNDLDRRRLAILIREPLEVRFEVYALKRERMAWTHKECARLAQFRPERKPTTWERLVRWWKSL